MKRVFAAVYSICTVCVMTLSSCGKSQPENISLPDKFSVKAEITDRDFTANAEMLRLENGWEITVTEPETLKGMEITLTDADCKIAYSELSYTASNKDLPANSALRLTAQALDRCVKSKTEGKLNGADYKVTFKDGKPKSLEIGGEIEVKFSGYKA